MTSSTLDIDACFARFRDRVQEPALIEVIDHWHRVRAGRAAPGWSDLDPSAMRRQLPIVWAWRYDPGAEDFIGRLAGEDVVAVIGCQIRGKRLRACFPESIRQRIFDEYRKVVAGPSLMHSIGRVYQFEHCAGVGERIVMPLSGDGETMDGLLGATVYRLGRCADRASGYTFDKITERVSFVPLACPGECGGGAHVRHPADA